METAAHLERLTTNHRTLDQRISDEITHPGYDELKISELKREKLRLKEQIERLRHSVSH